MGEPVSQAGNLYSINNDHSRFDRQVTCYIASIEVDF
jgi:hypothetical protein